MDESEEDIDQMFSTLLGEMDLLTQSLGVDTLPPPDPKPPSAEFNYSVGFKDLNESLLALEDQDLDALMADLMADISEAEQMTLQAPKEPTEHQRPSASAGAARTVSRGEGAPPLPAADLPPPPPPPKPLSPEEEEAQAKADKIKLALEKLKEAKVKKLVVKVHMNDNSTKSLMVDERQLARDILENLFEKTHCDCNVDWCLYEVYPELHIERFLEDHENVVEILTDWTRDTENKVLFLEKEEKYDVFKNPQNFYLDNKGREAKETSEKMNAKNKETLLEENFCGTSIIVPELEAALYLKEDGKKSWKRRYFLLRASGIYYVPKGKTKTSRDLACFIQFANVNVYYGIQCKMKYKAPTDHCFVLKHPQIQKESHYIKYLCCDDTRTLKQWVMGIRIAKYGRTLYDNYQRALERAGLAARWTSLGTNTAPPAPGPSQPNGQIPQASIPGSAIHQETQGHVETTKDLKPDLSSPDPGPGSHARKPVLPPPPPLRRSSDRGGPPSLPPKTRAAAAPAAPRPPSPPPPEDPELPPPPPPELLEAPPDFVPPPPGPAPDAPRTPKPPPPGPAPRTPKPPPPGPAPDAPRPPPPGPAPRTPKPPPPGPAPRPPKPPPGPAPDAPWPPPPPPGPAPDAPRPPPGPAVAKRPPVPPPKSEILRPPGAAGSAEQDFMSDLTRALQKKRGHLL